MSQPHGVQPHASSRRSRVIYEARKSRLRLDDTRVPFIRIRGCWLREAGFEIGSDVEIEVNPNQLIVRKATEVERLKAEG